MNLQRQRIEESTDGLRRAVLVVAVLNLVYGLVEFAVALAIGSVSLFADSVDFFEDASVNLLIFFALAWSLRLRGRIGMALAGITLLPALAGLWTAIEKLQMPTAPDALALGTTGLGALAINLISAFLLARFRDHRGSLARAAFLSARNDAVANVAIIFAGIFTAYLWHTAWPDLIVGIAIAAMNADAGVKIWSAAREEHASAVP